MKHLAEFSEVCTESLLLTFTGRLDWPFIETDDIPLDIKQQTLQTFLQAAAKLKIRIVIEDRNEYVRNFDYAKKLFEAQAVEHHPIAGFKFYWTTKELIEGLHPSYVIEDYAVFDRTIAVKYNIAEKLLSLTKGPDEIRSKIQVFNEVEKSPHIFFSNFYEFKNFLGVS